MPLALFVIGPGHVRARRPRRAVGHRPLPARPVADGDGLRRRRRSAAGRCSARGVLRTAWAVAAVLVIAYGVVFTATHVNFAHLRQRARFRGQSHAALEALLPQPEGARGAEAAGRCRRPEPQARSPTRAGSSTAGVDDVIARSDPRSKRAGSAAASPSTPRAARRSCARASPPTTPRPRTSRTRCRCPASPGRGDSGTTARMSAAESAPSRAARARDGRGARAGPAAPARAAAGGPEGERRWPYWLALAGLLAVALGLRLWGVAQGLPYAYNADENAHFVPRRDRAVRPRPEPALLRQPARLHVPAARRVRRLVRRPRGRVEHVRDRPDRGVRRRARHGRGRRDARRVAAVPRRRAASSTAASACSPRRCWPSRSCRSSTRTSRSTTCRRSRRSRCRCGARPASCAAGACATTLLAGIGLGLACATKYTGGIVLLPLLAAGAHRALRAPRRPGATPRARGLVLAGVVALGAFVVANPYAVLDFAAFRDGLQPPGRRPPSDDARQARPDPDHRPALLPVDVHLGPRLGAARRRRRSAASACSRRRPPPGARPRARADPLRALHGHAGALLRALAAARLPDRLPARAPTPSSAAPSAVARRAPVLRPALAALGRRAAARPGDRLLAPQRAWSSRARHAQPRPRLAGRARPAAARRSSSSRSCPTRGPATSAARTRRRRTAPAGSSSRRAARTSPTTGRVVPGAGADRQHRGLRAHALPGPRRPLRDAGLLLGRQSARPSAGRAEAQPKDVPQAIAYYRELEQRADVVYHASPVPRRREAGAVQLRLVVRLLPARLRAARPEMTIYRLRGGRCAPGGGA